MTDIFEKINNSGYDFFFLVVDKFLDIQIPQLSNFYSIYGLNLSTKNSGFLLSQPSTLEFINKTISKSGHLPAIVPFKPSAKIDIITDKNNWTKVSNPASLNRLLEDKIKFVEICQKNNLPIIPTIISTFNQSNFELAQSKFGPKIVIQTHFGWAGNSSFLGSNYNEIKDKIAQNTIVKYSQFIDGYSLINNCCLTSSGLIQSTPGLQYTGLPELTNNPLATVGRQWPSHTSDTIINQIYSITTQFSKVLTNIKYRGFFGLDFMVADNTAYLLECNPRLTASYAFYTSMEINSHLNPMYLYHLAEFINLSIPIDLTIHDVIGSEITKKNIQGNTTAKYNEFVDFSHTSNPIAIPQEYLDKVL